MYDQVIKSIFEKLFIFFYSVIGVHLCAGGTSSAFSGIFFRKYYLKFLNELYVIFKVYFSILLNNFSKV